MEDPRPPKTPEELKKERKAFELEEIDLGNKPLEFVSWGTKEVKEEAQPSQEPKKEKIKINLPPKPTDFPEIRIPKAVEATPHITDSYYYDEGKKQLELEVYSDGSTKEYDPQGKLKTHRDVNGTPIETPEPNKSQPNILALLDVTTEEDKPSLLKRTLGIGGLAGAIAAGGYAAKEAGKFSVDRGYEGPDQKATEKFTPKEKKDFYQSQAKDFSIENFERLKKEGKLVEQKPPEPPAPTVATAPGTISTNQPPSVAETEAAIRAKLKAEYDAEIAAFKAAKSIPAPAPEITPKSHREMIAEIEAKLSSGKQLTADEATMWNREISAQKVRETMERVEPKPRPPEDLGYRGPMAPPQNEYNGRPVGLGYNEPKQVQENPLNLSNKMLEQVEEIYGNNIEKIFPKDTLKAWRSVKDKSAYDLINKPEKKVPKEHKRLFDFLKKLKETTGIEPRSGVRGQTESIEEYIGRALQAAASKDLLNKLKL